MRRITRPSRILAGFIVAAVAALGMAVAAPAGAATGGVPGLVLWNHLGSTYQLKHSVVGQPLTQVGTVNHPPGVRGNGATSIGDDSYLSVSPQGFFGTDLKQGTVEIFLQKRMARAIPFETPLPAVFGVRPYDGGPWGPIAAFWSDGYTGNGGMQFQIVDAKGVTHTANDLGWDAVPVGTWVHMMFVWNVKGIQGNPDRMRIYRNGQKVASNKDTFSGIAPATDVVKVLATHMYDRLGKPALVGDELMVWDWAETP